MAFANGYDLAAAICGKTHSLLDERSARADQSADADHRCAVCGEWSYEIVDGACCRCAHAGGAEGNGEDKPEEAREINQYSIDIAHRTFETLRMECDILDVVRAAEFMEIALEHVRDDLIRAATVDLHALGTLSIVSDVDVPYGYFDPSIALIARAKVAANG